MVELSRRGLLCGMLAVLAAPAIVRVESLMQLPAKQQLLLSEPIILRPGGNNLLTIQQFTREAVKLWTKSNELLPSSADIITYDPELNILAPIDRLNVLYDSINRMQEQVAAAVMNGTPNGGLARLLGATSPLE